MSEIVEKIQKECTETLAQMILETISRVERQVVDQIGDFKSLSQQASSVVERFTSNMNNHFDELLDKEIIKDSSVFNFETLSLVQEEELDVIVALEGMVNASRNEHLPVFISFNTRLGSIFPRKRIDESSNPLDPEQIASAFQEALRPLSLDAQNTLTVYRAFNEVVLKNLDKVLTQGNKILIDSEVMPKLGVEGGPSKPLPKTRGGKRTETSTFGTVEEEAFDEAEERPELFSIMQNLLHPDEKPSSPGGSDGSSEGKATVKGTDASQGLSNEEFMIPQNMIPMIEAEGEAMAAKGNALVPGAVNPMQPFQPKEGQTVQMVDQVKLMEILTNIQERLNSTPVNHAQAPSSLEEVEKLDISQSLGEILRANSTDENVVSAVDRQSSDIINLVTLLYEAIWQDNSVPIPIKELIGRTQVTIIKVALADVNFFNNENHPARTILNEFAEAGIGWSEVDNLDGDPLYRKIKEIVDRILTEFTNDIGLFEELIADFRAFRAKESAHTRELEQNILRAKERKERMDDIYELVSQKIEERILGRELDPFVDDLLNSDFHKFMVMLVIKEGPGSNAWKQAINTIDVLLWTVEPKEQEEDRERLETVNQRLLNNLRKALRISKMPKDVIEKKISKLLEVQRDSFPADLKSDITDEQQPAGKETDTTEASATKANSPADAAEKPNAEEVAASTPRVRFLAAGEVDESVKEKQSDAGVSASDKEKISTHDAENKQALPGKSKPEDRTQSDGLSAARDSMETTRDKSAIADDNDIESDSPYLRQVDELSVGMWLEFVGDTEETNIRCKLAAKIKAIDKFIFVNRQGVKVLEKTRIGLARELRDGTVSVVSDSALFSRALESVIGNLRENKIEQQTGSAYQPDREAG